MNSVYYHCDYDDNTFSEIDIVFTIIKMTWKLTELKVQFM